MWRSILGGLADPRRPWSVAARPEIVQRDRVLVGVHAGPEAPVPERGELAVGGQALHRLALEHRVLAQVREGTRLEGEEAAVDPVLRLRLLAEATDAVLVVEHRDAERQLRPDDGDRRERAGGLVARAQSGEVD